MDVLMEALDIFFQNDIPFRIEGTNPNEGTLLIQATTEPGSRGHRKAIENLQVLISDYQHYRYGSPNDGGAMGADGWAEEDE